MTNKWLCFRFDSPNLLSIISALMRKENWVRVKFIKISFKNCPNAETHADIALKTTKSLPSSKIGRSAKYQFYIWQYNWLYRTLMQSDIENVACANGLKGINYLVVAASRELKIPILFVERAPLPGRLQIDWKGVNFGSSIPRDPSFYRSHHNNFPSINWKSEIPSARSSIKGSNVKQIKDKTGLLGKQNYIFCPLQVPTDSQLTVYGGWIEGMNHFIEVLSLLAPELPEGVHFRVKEHPTSKVSFTDKINRLDNLKIILDNDTDSMDLIRYSRAVLTINSTVGLQAFYFGKSVITLGKAFYSFGNMTSQAENISQLCELIKNIDKIQHSDLDRDLFMRFLYFWYPKTESILEGDYCLDEAKEQFAWLQRSLSQYMY